MRFLKLLLLSLILVLTLCCGCADNTLNSQSTAENSHSVSQDNVSVVSVSNAELPIDSYDCQGKNYIEISDLFINAGFTNVALIPQNSDKTKETRVNESVIAVIVNNNVIFSKGALYNSNVEIKIYYVVSDITENVSSVTSSTVSDNVSNSESSSYSADNNSSTANNSDNSNSTYSAVSENSVSNNATGTENQSNIVWVTEKGKKYHNKSTCSAMKSPIEISKEQAEQQGYEPCKRCYS